MRTLAGVRCRHFFMRVTLETVQERQQYFRFRSGAIRHE
ncbi:hypothetical protein J2785_005508 [Burkholderia ambifaria]|nr:hypothetical protein [Burkholderia ambifaria]